MIPGDDYWPPGEQYRTPPVETPLLPRCKVCGSRHDKPMPWCDQDNTGMENDDV